MLRHAAYIEALSAINDDTALAWKSTLAGLIVLRLVDDWLDLDTATIARDTDSVQIARTTVAAIPHCNPVRAALDDIINAIVHRRGHPFRKIAPRLLAYGRTLHWTNEWRLAKEVFATLLSRAQQYESSEVYLQAVLQLAFATRRLSEYEESSVAYTIALHEAQRLRDSKSEHRAQIGIALKLVEQGYDIRHAETLMNNVIRHARHQNDVVTVADAFHNLAHFSHVQGNYTTAIQHARTALTHAHTSSQQLRILSDLAASLDETGQTNTARDIYLHILSNSREEWFRRLSVLNLMIMAIQEHDEYSFHTCRRLLANAPLQPLHATYYHHFLGRGYEMFQHSDRATTEYATAQNIATTNGIGILH